MQIIIRSSRHSGRSTYLVNELLSYIKDEEDLNVLVLVAVKNSANTFIDLLSRVAKKEKDYIKESLVINENKIFINNNIIRVIPCYDFERKIKGLLSYDIIAIDDADKCDVKTIQDIINQVKNNTNKLLLMTEEEK